jgi:hypothetical protein
LLLKIAEKRIDNIDIILLAKVLVIEFRYREIYNKIILNEDFLFTLQDIANDMLRFNYQFTRKDSRGVIIRSKRDEVGEIDKDVYKMPEDLRRILIIKPYFEKAELSKYTKLLQEEKTQQSNKNLKLEAAYLEEFKRGNLKAIVDLSVLPPHTKEEIENTLISQFISYDINKKRETIRILKSSSNISIANVIYQFLKDGNIDDISLKKEVLEMLLSAGVDISEYVIGMKNSFNELDSN